MTKATINKWHQTLSNAVSERRCSSISTRAYIQRINLNQGDWRWKYEILLNSGSKTMQIDNKSKVVWVWQGIEAHHTKPENEIMEPICWCYCWNWAWQFPWLKTSWFQEIGESNWRHPFKKGLERKTCSVTWLTERRKWERSPRGDWNIFVTRRSHCRDGQVAAAFAGGLAAGVGCWRSRCDWYCGHWCGVLLAV